MAGTINGPKRYKVISDMKHGESGYISIDSLGRSYMITKTKKEIYVLFLDTEYTADIYNDIEDDIAYTIPLTCHIAEHGQQTFDIDNQGEIIPYYQYSDLKDKLYILLNAKTSAEKIFIDDTIERQTTEIHALFESLYRVYGDDSDKENSGANYGYVCSSIIKEYITEMFFDPQCTRDKVIEEMLAIYSYFYSTDRRQVARDVHKHRSEIKEIFRQQGLLKSKEELLSTESKTTLGRLESLYQEIHTFPPKKNTHTKSDSTPTGGDLKQLQQALEKSLKSQDFELAAKIRDEIENLKNTTQSQSQRDQDDPSSNE